MKTTKEDNDDEIYDKIEILSSNDEKLKFLGELLSNESSRNILLILNNQEMSANDLSEKTGLRLSLIIHHLNKMQQVGIVKISKIGKNSKNHDVKYYSAKHGIIILTEEAAHRAKKSKTFLNATKRVFRFASIGVAGLLGWFIMDYSNHFNNELVISGDDAEPILQLEIIVGLTIIIIGMTIERVFSHYRR